MSSDDVLPIDPVISDEIELRQALKELQQLDVAMRKRAASLDREVRAIYERAGQHLVNVLGQSIPADVRAKSLQEAIINFANDYREELLKGRDKKSIEYPEGTLAWRTVPATIAASEGVKPDDIIERADKVAPWTIIVRKVLEKVKLFGVGFFEMFDVVYKPSMANIKKAWQAKRLKPADLKKLGLEVVPERESAFFKLPEVSLD
ncbi:hypothetical protein Plim_4304 (plasmid) [Planctopirus limnophila DSM 3776]|uniref:Uncharacterized protein n=1 Tax=Planctopirus limnophila (strain ATCC 43296 / DSM 3776 / IFAM 1008 / Mu 290) TaxID=521674 RepID=D5SZJ1_PLAL2|nr:host-nuclease inhibitor Gam family protein [Planctopirus limnophila]ADG70111.1 hypothetical protein Plim_4304 [Planctopirus limnophila DSM 3776]